MDRPVTVYLDSQDLSRLSSADDRYQPILIELRALRGAGVARFPFSDVQVLENLPTSPDHACEGLQRIELLAELAEGQNLPSSDRIIEHELRALWATALQQSVPPLKPGEWFPQVDIPLADPGRWRQALKDNAKESHPMLTRSQRRQLVKVTSHRRGRAADDAITAGVDELLAKYPLRPGDRAALIRYFTGTLSRHELLQYIRNGIQDVALFARWIATHWTEGGHFAMLLRDPGQRFHQSLIDYFDRIQSVISDVSPQLYDQTVRPTLARVHREFLSGIASRLLRSVLDVVPPGNRPPGAFTPALTPSLHVVIDFFVCLCAQSSTRQQARDPRKRGRGDFGDALHALYLPRVDLFRADAATGALLLQNKATPPEKIVRRLEDLPAAIRAMHAGRITATHASDT